MINQLMNYINRQKLIMQTFSESTQYLDNGIYKIDNSLKGIRTDDHETKNFVKNNLINKNSKEQYSYIKYLVHALFIEKNLKVEKEEKHPGFGGSIFLPSNNGTGDVKIFDITNRKVLSLYSNEKNYINKLNKYIEFKGFFKIPEIIYTNDNNKILIEELVEFKSESQWNQEIYIDVFERILNQYKEYGQDIVTRNKVNSSRIENMVNQSNYDLYAEKKFPHWLGSEILNWSFPLVQIHGDMWSANILLANNNSDIYIIDWDNSNEQFFFNDIFWFITYEFIHMNNDYLINSYFNGVFDDTLTAFFNLFGAEFKTVNKTHYLEIAFFFSMTAKGMDTQAMDKNMQLFNKKITYKFKVEQ
ncbi:hypothetical protein DHX103_03635 [Planococcus sp. X10-3]|uniref:hypothetical protein n=1 Tax=Planococcus sp. X10-3 TaxID=3061240 RepID=UPI003BB0F340